MNKISNVKAQSHTDLLADASVEMSMEISREISSYRYNKAIQHIMLLRSMNELTNDEVKRLISQLQSPDEENWTVAEECIKQKLS